MNPEYLIGINPFVTSSPFRRYHIDRKWTNVQWRMSSENGEGLVAHVTGYKAQPGQYPSMKPEHLFLKELLQGSRKEQTPESLALDVLQVWSFLNEKGIPTIPWVDYDRNKKSLIMPDLTADGSHILDIHQPYRFGSKQLWKERGSKIHVAARERLKNDTSSLLKKAFENGNGYYFNIPSFAVLFDENWDVETAKVLLLDLGRDVFKIKNGICTFALGTFEPKLSTIYEDVEDFWDKLYL